METSMVIERTAKEIVIRLPGTMDIGLVQELLDYLKFKTLRSKSKATLKDIETLADEINRSWRPAAKKKRAA